MLGEQQGKRGSPLEALLLQQAPERLQVPDIGSVVQPHVFTVLKGVVTELLPQPLLQIATCAGERVAVLILEMPGFNTYPMGTTLTNAPGNSKQNLLQLELSGARVLTWGYKISHSLWCGLRGAL